MHLSKVFISLLLTALPLSLSHPVQHLSAIGTELSNLTLSDSNVHTLVSRVHDGNDGVGTVNDPVKLRVFDLAWLDPHRKASKIYRQMDALEDKPLKSNKKYSSATAAVIADLDGCFGLIVEGAADKGVVAAHCPPSYCRWLEQERTKKHDPTLEEKEIRKAKKFQVKLEKLLKSKKKDLRGGRILIVNGPESNADVDRTHREHIAKVLAGKEFENGDERRVEAKIHTWKVPKYADGEPGKFTQEVFEMRDIKVIQEGGRVKVLAGRTEVPF